MSARAASETRILAVHAFSYRMYERNEWYPVIGFDKELFGEELVKSTRRLCGNAFTGVCDADLPPIIVRESAFSKKPKFIYWLTLNTHVPVTPNQALTDFRCEDDAGIFQHMRVCEMAELWHDVFASVSKLALDPSIGPAEILVVGDHAGRGGHARNSSPASCHGLGSPRATTP